jgi:hypothetical protein
MRYLAAREISVAHVLHRHFWWYMVRIFYILATLAHSNYLERLSAESDMDRGRNVSLHGVRWLKG